MNLLKSLRVFALTSMLATPVTVLDAALSGYVDVDFELELEYGVAPPVAPPGSPEAGVFGSLFFEVVDIDPTPLFGDPSQHYQWCLSIDGVYEWGIDGTPMGGGTYGFFGHNLGVASIEEVEEALATMTPGELFDAGTDILSGLPGIGDFGLIFDALEFDPAFAPFASLDAGYDDVTGTGGALFAIPVSPIALLPDGAYLDVAGVALLELKAVPEPSTYGLIGAGALVLMIGVRRFKKAKNVAA